MNPQEREQLAQFLDQLVAARVNSRDAEAEAMIREACNRQPDAAYILAQRTMIQAHALKAAQDEIARLRTSNAGGGFLDNNAWGNQASLAPPAPPPRTPAATNTPAALGGGWLGNAASMAAGVVAGSFLFQGLEHLLNRPTESHGLLDQPLPNSAASENTTINNYFADNADALASLDDGLGDGFGGDDGSWL